MHPTTQALHTPYALPDAYGALAMPVYHCASYEFSTAEAMIPAFTGESDLPDYSRVTNPTVTHLEHRVRALTGARDVVAFSSGMAAISNLFLALAQQGKNIVTSRHVFGNTYALLQRTLARFGVETRYADLTDHEQVRSLIDEHTCCLYLEVLTNPQLEVPHLHALAQIAHAAGVPLVADSTAIPFTHTRLHELGVDIEVLSSTKYLSGGGTSIGGLLIDYGSIPELDHRLRQELLLNLGAYMTPHAAYMQTLGLETLAVRYARQAATAQQLAEWLEQQPQLRRVTYAGLPTHPQHELAREQFGHSYGAMLTFDLEHQAACFALLNRLHLFRRATNLFDSRSLAIHPHSTIFANCSDEERAAMHIDDTTIRLSIGLEEPSDLQADLLQALNP